MKGVSFMFKVTCDGDQLTFNNPNNAIGVYITLCKDRGLSFEGVPFVNDEGVLIGMITEHDRVNVGYTPGV